jgi:uroporphyrinogen III methyltransferase/synthase
VVVYDNLVSDELIVTLPEGTEQRYVGKCPDHHALPQDKINELLVELARAGKRVVRLKGGDPFVFGRGGEESQYLREHNVRFEVVPGVSAGVGVPAYAGIPLTDRRKSSFVTFLTGHKAVEKSLSSVPWDWLGQAHSGTLVIYMGVAELEENVARLMSAGMSPDTPAVAIERGTFPTQRTLRGKLSTLVRIARDAKLRPPALFIIGESVQQRDTIHWFEDRPLFGLRVMVIRPAHQARPLYTDLRNLGAEVLPYPTIATRDDFDEAAWTALQEIATPNRWLILSSENGVRYFLAQWQTVVGDVRRLADYKIATVGQGTLRALQQQALAPDFVPVPGTSSALTEQLIQRSDVAGATVVRVRGNLENDRVETALAAAGAQVLPLRVYRTATRTWSGAAREKLFAHPPEVMIVTSGTSLDGLAANLSEADLKQLASRTVVASIGPTTSRKLETLGFRVVVEAGKHTIPALLDALLAYHRRTPIARLS